MVTIFQCQCTIDLDPLRRRRLERDNFGSFERCFLSSCILMTDWCMVKLFSIRCNTSSMNIAYCNMSSVWESRFFRSSHNELLLRWFKWCLTCSFLDSRRTWSPTAQTSGMQQNKWSPTARIDCSWWANVHPPQKLVVCGELTLWLPPGSNRCGSERQNWYRVLKQLFTAKMTEMTASQQHENVCQLVFGVRSTFPFSLMSFFMFEACSGTRTKDVCGWNVCLPPRMRDCPIPLQQIRNWHWPIVFPNLFRSWTTRTPKKKSEYCCINDHFVRAVQTISLHLFTSVVGDVVEHIRKDDIVWKTIGFVPILRHVFCVFQYLKRCVSKTCEPFNVYRLSLMSLLFLCNCHFSWLLLPSDPKRLTHWLDATHLGWRRRMNLRKTCTFGNEQTSFRLFE